MKSFTIDAENSITAYARSAKLAACETADCETFRSERELAGLAENWPVSRLAEIWNSLPGVVPVKKFKDRPTAVTRVWKAIQALQPAASTAKKRGSKPRQAGEPSAREGSKKAQFLALLRAPEGATLAALMKATGWQAHSVRGFISGSLGKKMGLAVESFKNEAGERAYRIQG